MSFVEITILSLKSNRGRPCVRKHMAPDKSGHKKFKLQQSLEKGISITGTLTRRSVPNCLNSLTYCCVILEEGVNSCQPPCALEALDTSFLLVQGHPLHNQPQSFPQLLTCHGEYACALLRPPINFCYRV